LLTVWPAINVKAELVTMFSVAPANPGTFLDAVDAPDAPDVADVAVASSGDVLLLTRNPSVVTVFDSSGQFVRQFGADLLSARPHGIAVGFDDTVYVVDELAHAVWCFTADGTHTATLGAPNVHSDTGYVHEGSIYTKTLSVTRAGAPFHRPTAVAVSPNGERYVTDGYGNAAVHRFAANGTFMHSFGGPGSDPGQFRLPHALVVTANTQVVVADRENDRLQVFDATGTVLDVWNDVQRPCALGLDASGHVYVGELTWWPGDRSFRRGVNYAQAPARISVFTQDGTLLHREVSGGDGTGEGEFIAPHGLAVTTDGSVLLAEVAHSFCVARGIEQPDVNRFHRFRFGA